MAGVEQGDELAHLVVASDEDVAGMAGPAADPSPAVVGSGHAAGRILAARPDARVVVLTSFSDRTRIFDALDAAAVRPPDAAIVAAARASVRSSSRC